MVMARRARELARDRGLLDRAVFFNEQWVPYEQRVNYLCDGDVAISLHQEHVETRFSFRTRFLDCLWVGLPILATQGDVLGEAAVEAGAGVAVKDGDTEGVAAALRQLTVDADRRRTMSDRARVLAHDYTWERVAQPLLRFCAAPSRAADADTPDRAMPRFKGPTKTELVLAAYRLDGLPGVRRRAARQLRRWGGRAWHRLKRS
jgi:hypothetical protein